MKRNIQAVLGILVASVGGAVLALGIVIAFALIARAEDAAPKPDPALAYQTARAEAAEAALAVAARTIKDLQLQANMNAAAANYCTLDWGDLKQMQVKADAAKKALEALKPTPTP